MNLPNKLTILRVILIPFFVVFMLFDITGAADKWIDCDLLCCQPDRYAGWENRQKVQPGNELR